MRGMGEGSGLAEAGQVDVLPGGDDDIEAVGDEVGGDDGDEHPRRRAQVLTPLPRLRLAQGQADNPLPPPLPSSLARAREET